MKHRYTITSTSFEGELTFTYNEEGILTGFFNDATLSEKHLDWLHRNFPVVQVLLERMAGNSETLTIRLTTNEVTFEQFWEAYNYKVDKQEAKKAFDKLTKDEQIKAFETIPSYNFYLMMRPNTNRLYPATYLRGKFENDYKSLAKATQQS
ncbi:hypothetical protein DYU11_18330 [Fibrisoma montanum]|uniref:Uncharacterized protein n=2 Tax=Fibrisoma montanum TaxID=2305895 RepID=A0A418M672_9BACT|nr:hypothetical protein DYU11_18330 [Fibrisoma montanum]